MNKKKIWVLAAVILAVSISAFLLLKPGHSSQGIRIPQSPPIEFSRYISAFSGGILSCDAGIQIQFVHELIDSTMIGQQAPAGLLQIQPSLKGEAFWIDTRTLEFRPEDKMPHNRSFTVRLHLSKLLNVSDDFKTFRFEFITMPQTALVQIDRISSYYANHQPRFNIYGSVKTADFADPVKIKDLITIQGAGTPTISWQSTDRNRYHEFIIEDIVRDSKAMNINILWNGKCIEANSKGSYGFVMPQAGKFELVHMNIAQMPQPGISLYFSEPVRENQNLAGLISLSENQNLSTRINGNEIVVYLNQAISGRQILSLETAIRDIHGNPLSEKLVREIEFEDIKPAIRFTGKGNIIPLSNDLLFPFEAVNLSAVDVKIIRIFESNILQFFQVNQIDGNDQLRRVGRIIATRTVPLITQEAVDYNKWNRFTLDLSSIVEPEPGAIYRVIMSFKKDYSLYTCLDGQNTEAPQYLYSLDTGWERISDQISYWDSYEGYEYYDDYNWYERDNPCHNTYYYHKNSSRNILASNLGITAKKGNDDTWHFIVSDIVSTEPLSGVTIQLFNFQQQIIETVTTNNNGLATAKPTGKPFLLVASKDKQKGYLRLDDGSSLSVSMFDVGGDALKQGLKAFIYGERGIWRPGDTLYLNMIIEDKSRQLPVEYPVVFQLYNPLGQLIQSQVNNKGLNGFYSFTTVTDPDAPTGNWMARFKVGGTEFSQTLRIETIMPNRLRINTSFSNDQLLGYATSKGTLKSEWLHGATARNLRAEITATLSPAKTRFEKYKDFEFDDPTRIFHSETFTLFNSRLNNSGEADLQIGINVSSQAPGVLRANIETKVYEEGGAFSVDRFPVPFYPYRSYAGVKKPQPDRGSSFFHTDTEHVLELVSVDRDGKLVPNSKLRVDVFKVQWRWWWDSSRDYLGDFSSGSFYNALQTQTIDAPDGTARFNFKVNYPEWGRYLVLVTNLESQHRTGTTLLIDWPYWYGANREGRQQAATMLSFASDKENYKVGEDIVITFPSSSGARAMLSLENGSGVISNQWVKTKDENTTVKIKATSTMAPNVYAHITLLQPHAQTVNDLPIRLYGVIPIMVEDPGTRLQPVITMPDVLKPEQTVSIQIKEQQGKPMTYTLAMVDEGLLDLTRFSTPQPWRHFFTREALGVKTWDMFDQVMGAFGSEFSRLLATGGDDEIQAPPGAERANRFKPVVKFFGPFALDKGKSNTHTFKMPQYAGSVRLMLVAGQNGAYGHAEKTVPVRQSLMAAGTLPRVLGSGETVKFPVNVFAMDETIKNATITVETNDMLVLQGNKTQSLSFSETGDKMVWFEFQTPLREGVARVKTTVTSGNETVVIDTELNVRNANPRVTSVESIVLDGNTTREITINLIGMESTRNAMLEVSAIPPLNLEKRLEFLLSYPHGCSEQIVSAAFPQLYLETFHELSPEQKEKLKDNIQSVIDRILQRQVSNGGITLWPGNNEAYDWVTSYAGHFMLEVQTKGFVVPTHFLNSWKNYQREMSRRWMPDVNVFGDDLMQAYRLYTLALSGQPELAAMNRLRQREQLSDQAKWQLAAAYFLAGQNEAAMELIQIAGTDIKPYEQVSYTYGDDNRDKAMIIHVLSMLKQKDKAAFLVEDLSAALSLDNWMSTQTTAYCLMALSKFYEGSVRGDEIHFIWAEDGSNENVTKSKSLVSRQTLRIPSGTDLKKLKISNKGLNTLYARVIYWGIPVSEEEQVSESNMRMQVRFTDLKGNTMNVQRLPQGTSFIAEVTVANTGFRGNYRELALTRIFPSGWEISNARLTDSAAGLKQDDFTYEDIRDDRVYTYFDLNSGRSKTFKVLLTATYEGRFYLPGFNVEAMYDASVYARNKGMWIEVFRDENKIEL